MLPHEPTVYNLKSWIPTLVSDKLCKTKMNITAGFTQQSTHISETCYENTLCTNTKIRLAVQ